MATVMKNSRCTQNHNATSFNLFHINSITIYFQVANTDRQLIVANTSRSRPQPPFAHAAATTTAILKIRVPADGVLISGQAIAIDESSMTGDSKIVSKNHKSPFLLSVQ
ncbi:uncharacterized protein LOC141641932 [Silene latifolia]|uniref:uncharacterized protein LOC141641932 n=1 Tax=Silene latifolia TaxID=37657 RepID=UPI003D778ABA